MRRPRPHLRAHLPRVQPYVPQLQRGRLRQGACVRSHRQLRVRLDLLNPFGPRRCRCGPATPGRVRRDSRSRLAAQTVVAEVSAAACRLACRGDDDSSARQHSPCFVAAGTSSAGSTIPLLRATGRTSPSSTATCAARRAAYSVHFYDLSVCRQTDALEKVKHTAFVCCFELGLRLPLVAGRSWSLPASATCGFSCCRAAATLSNRCNPVQGILAERVISAMRCRPMQRSLCAR